MIAFLVLNLMVGTSRHLEGAVYLFFEGGLIPMFTIIGIWGGPRRVYASFKFFLTAARPVLMCSIASGDVLRCRGTDMDALLPVRLDRSAEMAVCLLRLIRGEDADVAGPHMVAGRAC
jgi:NADH:ubiquinone oxidoreductase subunit 4 (subunit M)